MPRAQPASLNLERTNERTAEVGKGKKEKKKEMRKATPIDSPNVVSLSMQAGETGANFNSRIISKVCCCCCYDGRPHGNTREYSALLYIAELHGYITGRISIPISHRCCASRPVDKPLPPPLSLYTNRPGRPPPGYYLSSEPGIGLEFKNTVQILCSRGLCSRHGRTREYED